MKKHLGLLILILLSQILISPPSFSQERNNRTQYFPKSEKFVKKIPDKENVWVFILAGQSNMSGRAFVEPQDTIPYERIWTINAKDQVVVAKEPLHFYEPTRAGLDCGLSFGKALLKHVPTNISILLIPTAVGGSTIEQWLQDSTHRNVKLLSNFRDKSKIGKKYGLIKAILWHQGESDANREKVHEYQKRLSILVNTFRSLIGDENIPILIGELGSFGNNTENWNLINLAIQNYTSSDNHSAFISTHDLKDKGDNLHFNSEAQREIGKRFADVFIKKFN